MSYHSGRRAPVTAAVLAAGLAAVSLAAGCGGGGSAGGSSTASSTTSLTPPAPPVVPPTGTTPPAPVAPPTPPPTGTVAPLVGSQAPDFTVTGLDGQPVRLSDLRGHVVVLDFWASWCPNCQAALPYAAPLIQKYAAQGVVCLAVNVWDTPSDYRAYVAAHPELAPLRFASDPAPAGQDVGTTVYDIPYVTDDFVIDRNGKIIRQLTYTGQDSYLEDAIKAALASG